MNGGVIFWIVIAAIALLAWIVARFVSLVRQARAYRELRPELDGLQAFRADLERRENSLEQKTAYDKSVVEYLATEKSKGFPWLAKAYADFFQLGDK